MRSIISPLLVCAPLAWFCVYFALDGTRDARQFLPTSLAYPLLICLAGLCILVLLLRRFHLAGALVGFWLGLLPALLLAFAGGFLGIMLLTFGPDGGSMNVPAIPANLSIFAALVLTPLVTGAGLGALVGQRISEARLARAQ